MNNTVKRTVDEAQRLRHELEQDIAGLLRVYSERTGMTVKYVNVLPIFDIQQEAAAHYDVQTEVAL